MLLLCLDYWSQGYIIELSQNVCIHSLCATLPFIYYSKEIYVNQIFLKNLFCVMEYSKYWIYSSWGGRQYSYSHVMKSNVLLSFLSLLFFFLRMHPNKALFNHLIHFLSWINTETYWVDNIPNVGNWVNSRLVLIFKYVFCLGTQCRIYKWIEI